MRRLLARHALAMRITALAPGRLAFGWAFTPVGTPTRHPVLAALSVTARRAGSARVTLRLDRAMTLLLRRARHGVGVAGTAQFVPRHGRRVTARLAFRLAR